MTTCKARGAKRRGYQSALLAALWLIVSTAPACGPGGPPSPAPQGAEKTRPGSPVQQQRRLAMLPPTGDSPVDRLIVQAQQSIGKFPDKVDPWVLLGRLWVRKARESADPAYFLNADASAQAALDLLPDAPIALDLRGLVLLNDHKFEQARELAQRIVRARPDDPMAYGTLSDALLELGRFAEAVAAAQQMIDLKPNLPSYSRGSYLRWLTGDVAGARALIRSAIDATAPDRRDPEPRAWVLVQAALYFWHEGDSAGADAGLDMALQLFPDYPAALVGKARVALGQGEAARAAGLLARAYRQNPLVETAWLLGDARALAGDAAGAAAAYELVVRQGRRGDPRTLALYWATKDLQHQEALRLIEEERRQRGDTYTQDVYALALYRAGRLAEARAAIDAATGLGTRDARLWFHAGVIHLGTGDAALGRRWLQQALALNPHFDVGGAAEARKLLGQR